MSFYGIERNPINFSIIPDPLVVPVPVATSIQVPSVLDLGTATTGDLTASQLLCGSLYFNPASLATWTLPSGDEMIRTFGKGLDKYMNAGAIVRLEIVNYGVGNVRINASTGGTQGKTFAGGAGTGVCDCLNIKFLSATGGYIVF
jgi:hypothetical protein